MHLKRLEISGFKSFGKKTELEFTTPITAIVGPNGSGKSNVAEAFRFVLGEQSIKSMRGKRAEDLIFNGGKDATRANRAGVKVVFDNSKRSFNIDFDEVSVERAVHRDSSSEYAINGSSVRLRDISELLAQAHIGASGPHIISQGEADRILNASIRERREMLEDALGLKIYQYKRDESLRKLEKTEQNMKETESLRREIAPHIKFLKKQVEKIEKAEELRAELVRLYKAYFKREELYIAHEKQEVAREKQAPEAGLAKLAEELAAARATLARASSADGKSEELLELEGKLAGLRRERDTLAGRAGRAEGERASAERMKRRRIEDAARAGSVAVPLAEVSTLTERIERELSAVENSTDLAAIARALAAVRSWLRTFISDKQASDTSSDIADFDTEITRLSKELEAIATEKTSLEASEKELTARYEALKREIESEKDSSRDAEKAVFRIVAEENELRRALDAALARAERLKRTQDDFDRELKEASVLAGLEAIRFSDFVPVDESGNALSAEAIVREVRTVQEDRRRTIERAKIRLEDMGAGGASGEVLREYKEAAERDEFLAKELADLESASAALKALIAELEARIDADFKTGLLRINDEFGKYFTLMFGGGHARLEVIREKKRRAKSLADLEALGDELPVEEEMGEEGVEIDVGLPRKKTKGLMMLSGGERALTSIALLFAISQVNPPPFIILDETDAALDEANSRKYGDMVENLAKHSQLILITHNRETMSRAGVLYGVTMGSDGVSKLLSIAFDEGTAFAK